jgi:hypothetical protein
MLMSAGTCRGILSEISVITQEERGRCSYFTALDFLLHMER